MSDPIYKMIVMYKLFDMRSLLMRLLRNNLVIESATVKSRTNAAETNINFQLENTCYFCGSFLRVTYSPSQDRTTKYKGNNI